MKNKHRKIIGITLIIIGCSAVGIRVGGKFLFDRDSKNEVDEFLSSNIVEVSNQNITSNEAYKDIKPGDKIGVIEIPSLGIQHIIVHGTEVEHIRKNVGHFEETAMPGEYGNFSVAGHRNNLYNEVFKGLADVEIGEQIKVKALNGEFVYKIYKKDVIEPEAVEVLYQELSKKEMTMITCTTDGKQRVCVKARLMS